MKFTSDLLSQSEKSNFGFVARERQIAAKKYKQPNAKTENETAKPSKGVSKRFILNSFFGLCIIAAGFSVVFYLATKPSDSQFSPTESPIIDKMAKTPEVSELTKNIPGAEQQQAGTTKTVPEVNSIESAIQGSAPSPSKPDVAKSTNLKGENALTTYLVVFQSLSSQQSAFARLEQLKPTYEKAYIQPAGNNFRIILDSITTFEPAMAISEQMKKKYGEVWITRK